MQLRGIKRTKLKTVMAPLPPKEISGVKDNTHFLIIYNILYNSFNEN